MGRNKHSSVCFFPGRVFLGLALFICACSPPLLFFRAKKETSVDELTYAPPIYRDADSLSLGENKPRPGLEQSTGGKNIISPHRLTIHDDREVIKDSLQQHSNGSLVEQLMHSDKSGDDTSRFLVYYTASGFTNQLLSLQRAAHLALATNRTLVLPPILPHKTADRKNLQFPAFGWRGVGSKCAAMDKYIMFAESAHQDVLATRHAVNVKNNVASSSYSAILDLNQLKSTGLKIIDMPEFAKEESNTEDSNWCKGNDHTKLNMVRNCGHKTSFHKMVETLQQSCGTERVAVIGAAYTIPHITDKDEIKAIRNNNNTTKINDMHEISHEVIEKVEDFFNQLPPSLKVQTLLKGMYHQLAKPAGEYLGVHIRFKDGLTIDNCGEDSVKKTYEQIFKDLPHPAKKDGSNKGSSGSNQATVLIGNSNPAAQRCFQHYNSKLGYSYEAVTINNILDSQQQQNENNHTATNPSSTVSLKKILEDVGKESDKSTVYLLLDMMLLGLANQVQYGKVKTNAGTFQARIKKIHAGRDTILKRLQIL